MLRKIILVLIIMLTLTGCYKSNDSKEIPYIHEMGPNEIECNSFYHYMPVEHGRDKIGLQRYDLITEKDQDIYVVEDLEKQSITSYYGDDKVVYFVVTTYQDGDDEKVLFCYDLNSCEYETLLATEEYLDVGLDSITNKILVITDSQDYFIENGSLYEVDSSNEVLSDFSNVESTIRRVDSDGTIVEISKKYKESVYRYSVDGKSGVITALSDCGGIKSGLSNFFVLEGDKIIGIVQIARKGNNGIIPCNVLETSELKKEILFSLNYKTGESEILYDSKNNTIRIIGYCDGKAYLYKKGKIFCRNLADGSEEEIYSISYDGDGQWTFNWIGSKLIIFDEDNHRVVANIQT